MNFEQARELITSECRRYAKMGSVEAIADDLHARGLSGKRRCGTECPLANGFTDTLMVMPGRLQVDRQGVHSANGKIIASFEPDFGILSDFVALFDSGHFPKLEQ